MSDFTTLRLEGNYGTLGAPVWADLSGANRETRWSDSAIQNTIASAVWPAMNRPGATSIVSYTYAYTADAVGWGYISGQASPCPAYSKDNYLWSRWWWDNLGSFASAPIYTAYLTTAHAAITRGVPDGGLLQGSNDTLNVSKFSYMKGNAFGRVTSAGAPAAGPAAAPVVTDGTVGSVSPAAGANWLANYQSLMGDLDYITAPFTPAATTQDQWNVHFAIFSGPNQVPSLYLVIQSLRYSWT
ncbi:MAG: hypothetical protein Q8O55_01495 [Dehalococcoidales bacterium]|nr:hypothetical protein [Dehalococcoidales bacterium]